MAQRDRVLLVHGLWMTGLMMGLMQRRIEQHGYLVECYSYPTIRLSLNENAERLQSYCTRFGADTLHLVGHSLGGLVVLNALPLMAMPCLGRIVVAGTPYTGSFSARRLDRLPGGRRLMGGCIRQWLDEPRAAALDRYEIGVIAGNGGVGLGRFIAPDLPRPNDGVVSVSETQVAGMRDHVVLDVSHTAMLASRAVVSQICSFLDEGRFSRGERAAA